MYKDFIKEWLLDEKSSVYSFITQTYGKQLLELKPTLFRKWLAKEIDVPEEKINLSSLNSALGRYRKSLNKNKTKPTEIKSVNASSEHEIKPHKEKEDFQFSDVNVTQNKGRITEY